MDPTRIQHIAGYRQADMHRAAARARLAYERSVEADERSRVRLSLPSLRRRPARRLGRAILGR